MSFINKIILAVCAIIALMVVVLTTQQIYSKKTPADYLILHNGRIFEENVATSLAADAMLLQGKFIIALGKVNELREIGPEASIEVDLKGRTILPGQIVEYDHTQTSNIEDLSDFIESYQSLETEYFASGVTSVRHVSVNTNFVDNIILANEHGYLAARHSVELPVKSQQNVFVDFAKLSEATNAHLKLDAKGQDFNFNSGTLKPGQFADFVIMDVGEPNQGEKVVETWVGGLKVYSSNS
jgi:dihydroorotase-like cyclic amidohydrolase